MTKKKIFEIIALGALALFIVATTIYLSFSYSWEEVLEFVKPIVTTAIGWLSIFSGSTLVVVATSAYRIAKMKFDQKKIDSNIYVTAKKTNEVIKNVKVISTDNSAFMTSTYYFCKYLVDREPSKVKKEGLQTILSAMKKEIESKKTISIDEIEVKEKGKK